MIPMRELMEAKRMQVLSKAISGQPQQEQVNYFKEEPRRSSFRQRVFNSLASGVANKIAEAEEEKRNRPKPQPEQFSDIENRSAGFQRSIGMGRKGSFTALTMLFTFFVFILFWTFYLGNWLNSWAEKTVLDHSLVGLEALILENINLIFLFASLIFIAIGTIVITEPQGG